MRDLWPYDFAYYEQSRNRERRPNLRGPGSKISDSDQSENLTLIITTDSGLLEVSVV